MLKFLSGANDVANSFATSVGSRSLKLWQAVCIALFTEAAGGILLGAETADTIKGKLISPALFTKRPELLMQGFMCSLISSSSWVMFATYMGWPVSTTHSIVGAIAGMGISAFGSSAVDWSWNGMGKIIASWFISPAVAGVIASIVYLITKFIVFRAKDTLRTGINTIPFFFAFTLSIMSFYVILKNGKNVLASVTVDYVKGTYTSKGDWGLTMGIVAAIFGGILILSYIFVVPFFKRLLIEEEKLRWFHVFYIFAVPKQPKDENLVNNLKSHFTPEDVEKAAEDGEDEYLNKSEPVTRTQEVVSSGDHMDSTPKDVVNAAGKKIKNLLYNSLFMDVASAQSRNAADAHALAIKYDNKTEYLYSFLQVCTAAFASFAHGSNDLANAVGPLAATYSIWQSASVSTSAPVPLWALVYGAVALDLGLALYGYNIMRNLGNNLTYHSPSRGFSMEFGAALTVITASFIGLPVSTTHCITGATIGVGLCNGTLKSVNWVMFAWTMFSWIITVPVAGLFAGLLYAFTTRGASFSY
ncbi:hypothetical protein HK096_005212 [Nowakowskiella sp. JEL0078]|nr:hypothetical protein HK096_005212 [Nowakowskiella sp. JEL0078]